MSELSVKPNSPVPLQCISIVLCESVYRVADRSNLIIVNTFHTLGVRACPCRFPKITVLYTVTGGHGTYETTLAIVNARSGQDVACYADRYTVRSPLTINDVHLILNGVPFPEAGKYWIELRCNGELIGQRPFYVEVAPRREGPPELGSGG